MADSSDSDSDCSPPAKTRKLDGAATYPSRFNSEWKKEFLFVTNVIGDPYRYVIARYPWSLSVTN